MFYRQCKYLSIHSIQTCTLLLTVLNRQHTHSLILFHPKYDISVYRATLEVLLLFTEITNGNWPVGGSYLLFYICTCIFFNGSFITDTVLFHNVQSPCLSSLLNTFHVLSYLFLYRCGELDESVWFSSVSHYICRRL